MSLFISFVVPQKSFCCWLFSVVWELLFLFPWVLSLSLSDREVMDVAAHLSLLKGHCFRNRRGDVRFWSPNHLEGFSCNSFFQCLVDPSPLGESVLKALWRIKILERWCSLLDGFFTVVLTSCIDSWGSCLCLLGFFCCILCRKAEENLDHILWLCDFTSCVWDSFL